MLALVATVGVGNAFHIGLVLTAFGFGFRHGIDWDHIAALSDITSSQETPRQSMWFATLYALGHALVVFVLGFAAIAFAQRLPAGIDGLMERFVGATLVILGCYVVYALARHGREFRMRSRWMLMFGGVRRGLQWIRARHVVHHHEHHHFASSSSDPFENYAPCTAFSVGMLHGVGAETPSQILIFVTAAGAGGRGTGLLLLVAFLVGLLSSNSTVALAGMFGFLGASRNFGVYVAVSSVTALFSIVIGSIFVLGSAALLPAMFGG
jgi:high-affinity nickel-transport protein